MPLGVFDPLALGVFVVVVGGHGKLGAFALVFQLKHLWIGTRKGTRYYFVYDQGYLPLENDWYMPVRRG